MRACDMRDNDFEYQLTPVYEELSVILGMKNTVSQQFVHNMRASLEENYDSTSGIDVEIKQDVKNQLTPEVEKNYKVLQPTASYSWRLSKLVMSHNVGKNPSFFSPLHTD